MFRLVIPGCVLPCMCTRSATYQLILVCVLDPLPSVCSKLGTEFVVLNYLTKGGSSLLPGPAKVLSHPSGGLPSADSAYKFPLL